MIAYCEMHNINVPTYMTCFLSNTHSKVSVNPTVPHGAWLVTLYSETSLMWSPKGLTALSNEVVQYVLLTLGSTGHGHYNKVVLLTGWPLSEVSL